MMDYYFDEDYPHKPGRFTEYGSFKKDLRREYWVVVYGDRTIVINSSVGDFINWVNSGEGFRSDGEKRTLKAAFKSTRAEWERGGMTAIDVPFPMDADEYEELYEDYREKRDAWGKSQEEREAQARKLRLCIGAAAVLSLFVWIAWLLK